MRGFQEYLGQLENLVRDARQDPKGILQSERVTAALDGEAGTALRRLVSIEELRDSGVFFTAAALAGRALQPISATLDDASVILDPACGAGDLLIACSRFLPTKAGLSETLEAWSKQLKGRDLFNEFVSAARTRLLLAVMQRTGFPGEGKPEQLCASQFFPEIKQECGLTDAAVIASATHVVMNPPFALVDAPKDCTWANGKINASALFVLHCVEHAHEGARIVAILPDVLRSGSRYERWRRLIENSAIVHQIELCGQFDSWADVDVFILHLEKTTTAHTNKINWRPTNSPGVVTVGDYFEIRVGSVVDYRDPLSGQEYPFIRSRGLPHWALVDQIDDTRQFQGRVFTPPFVAVRRTSRHGDKYRAIGTVVTHKGAVAVENHLLVLTPKDGQVQTCEQLLAVLRHSETDSWLDQRIRCRHLTVSSLSELPWRVIDE